MPWFRHSASVCDSGRLKIWYQIDRRGNKTKFVQDNLGRTVFNLGPTEYLKPLTRR